MQTHATSSATSSATSTRARLVEDNLPLVRHLARRMARRAHPYLEVDELVSIGTEALLHASDRFDPGRSVSFGSFAYLRVRGAMVEGLGHAGPQSRGRMRKRDGRERTAALPVVFAFDDTRHATGGARELGDALVGAIDTVRLAPRLTQALAQLEERDRMLVERHYFGGESLLEIGRELGVSKSWASRMHTRALARLRAALEGDAG